MAETFEYYKLQQGGIPNVKPGSNWFWIRVDFSLQPGAATDIYKLCEIKNHWILKSGFTRATVASLPASATIDIETAAGGDQIDAAVDITSGTDTWIRCDTLDDDGPIPITADSYIYMTLNTAAAVSGILDIMLEVIVAPGDEESVDSLGS
jgi:hypothetical protein